MKKILISFVFFMSFFSYPSIANEIQNWQLGFRDPASPVMQAVDDLHNFVLIMMTAITIFVLILIIYVVIRFHIRHELENYLIVIVLLCKIIALIISA